MVCKTGQIWQASLPFSASTLTRTSTPHLMTLFRLISFQRCHRGRPAGIDFHTQSPKTVNLFLCPPVSSHLAAFHHVLSLRGKLALLLVPDWPSTAFWSLLHPKGRVHPSLLCSKVFYPRYFSANSVPSLVHIRCQDSPSHSTYSDIFKRFQGTKFGRRSLAHYPHTDCPPQSEA